MSYKNTSQLRFRKTSSKKPYFEGFYFKLITEDQLMLILIAGISISKSSEYAFIQVISNKHKKNKIFKFPIEVVSNRKGNDGFLIANNQFNSKNIQVNLEDLMIDITLKRKVEWKRSLVNPNIMGFLSFIPMVQCKHDILIIDSEIEGVLKTKNNVFRFKKGKGYIEKNWGRSFPKNYLWIHANQFSDKNTSLQFAIAKPKWFLFSPTVYIGYLMFDKISHIGTHRLSLTSVHQSNNSILIKIIKPRKIIQITLKLKLPVQLLSPEEGEIKSLITEYLNSEVHLTIEKRKLFKSNTFFHKDLSSLSTAEVENIF